MAPRDRCIDLHRHKGKPKHSAGTGRLRTEHGRTTAPTRMAETAMIASNADSRVIAQNELRTARHLLEGMARRSIGRTARMLMENGRHSIERTGPLMNGGKYLISRTSRLMEKERTRAKPRRSIPTRGATIEVTYHVRMRHRRGIRGTTDHMVNSVEVTRKEERLVSQSEMLPMNADLNMDLPLLIQLPPKKQ